MTTRELVRHAVVVEGRPAGILERGAGDDAVVFLHGGAPAMSPYVGCAELWRPLLAAMSGGRRLIAIDLPGSGRSALPPAGEDAHELLVAGIAERVTAVLAELGVRRAVLVSHGRSSLVGFLLARRSPDGLAIAGHMAIAPLGTAPTGDAESNLALLHPPEPRWSRESQRWALTRLVERVDAVGTELIDTLVSWADSGPHREAVQRAQDAAFPGAFSADLLAARAAFNAYCRDTGYGIPISLVWGASDPLLRVDVGTALLAILATTRAHLELNVVNRVGHFPALEDPASVVRLLEPFVGLTSTA